MEDEADVLVPVEVEESDGPAALYGGAHERGEEHGGVAAEARRDLIDVPIHARLHHLRDEGGGVRERGEGLRDDEG